jgi:hypothetical protein
MLPASHSVEEEQSQGTSWGCIAAAARLRRALQAAAAQVMLELSFASSRIWPHFCLNPYISWQIYPGQRAMHSNVYWLVLMQYQW